MRNYMVVTASKGDTGLRVYSSRAPSVVVALRDSMRQDFKDYPNNPSSFSAVEIFAVERSELSI